MSSVYRDAVSAFFVGKPAPAEAVQAAEGQLGAASAVADKIAQLPIQGARQLASELVSTANQGFVGGMHWGVVVAACVTATAAVVAGAFLPARPRPEDAEMQRDEFIAEHSDLDVGGASPGEP